MATITTELTTQYFSEKELNEFWGFNRPVIKCNSTNSFKDKLATAMVELVKVVKANCINTEVGDIIGLK